MSSLSEGDLMNKREIILHPYLLGVFPVLSLYVHNIAETPFWEALSLCVGMLPIIALLLAGGKLIMKNSRKSAIAVSLFIFTFFLYGHIANLILDLRFHIGPNEFGPNAVIFPLFLLLFCFGVYFVRRIIDCNSWDRRLNLLSTLLVFLCLCQIGNFYITNRLVKHEQENRIASRLYRHADAPFNPDIYYIILDGYAREDVLKNVFHYDNNPFLEKLKSRGFLIINQSSSNYIFTIPSIASSLNMNYLNRLALEVGTDLIDQKPLCDMLIHNNVMEFLKKEGYCLITLSSPGFSLPERISADKRLAYRASLTAFQNQLLNLTPIPALGRAFVKYGGFQYALHRKAVLYQLKCLENLSGQPSPKFVYAHVFLPHEPFVFGPSGESREPNEPFRYRSSLTGEAYFKAQNDQLEFLNEKVVEIVDAILKESKQPPIIILQSDHGNRYNFNPHSYDNADWIIKNSMSNFMAFYLPGKITEKPYHNMTPVNVFRIIFNNYFGATLSLLPDRNYLSIAGRPYEFVDVSKYFREIKN